MKRITLLRGNIEFDFRIDRIKIIAGNNYHMKYEIIKIFRETFDNYTKSKILVNDRELNPKKSMLFDISPSFDLNSDLKMGSKSIAIRYINSILNNEMYYDSINTISILFKSLENEINSEEKDIHISFTDINIKQLEKLITTFLMINNEQVNMYDLSYEKLIIALINMIKIIEVSTTCENTFIILDLPILTEKIYEAISELKVCNTIIVTNDYKSLLELSDIYLCSKLVIDLADDNKIYSAFCEENNVLYELKEIQNMLKNYINKVMDSYTELIKNILE